MNISPTTDVEAGDLLSDDVHNPRLLRPSVPNNAPAEGESPVNSVASNDTPAAALRLGRAMLSEVEGRRAVARQNASFTVDLQEVAAMPI